jgi:hypothetical protein
VVLNNFFLLLNIDDLLLLKFFLLNLGRFGHWLLLGNRFHMLKLSLLDPLRSSEIGLDAHRLGLLCEDTLELVCVPPKTHCGLRLSVICL